MDKIKFKSYPKRIEVLGADFGYVTDYRYFCTDPDFFKAILEFEKEKLNRNSTGKIAVKHISIDDDVDNPALSLELWENDSKFSYEFKSDELRLVKASGGGNLNNIMRNWDEIISVLDGSIENIPQINFYAVEDLDKSVFTSFNNINFHNIEGEPRQAYIFINPDSKETVSFLVPRAELADDHHIKSELPHEAAYFIVGNEPYTSQGHMEFLIEHVEKYPDSRIFYIPSTIQVNSGYKNIEYFLEKVYALACNLTEAHILLGLDVDIVDPEESAEKVADIFHGMGIKHVVISHGQHGMFCSARHKSMKSECKNWDPIIDIRALLRKLPDSIAFLDNNGKIPINSEHELDVTGCGDAFTSAVFFYELLHLDEYGCHDISLAKYLAGLKSIYPYSNLKDINPAVLLEIMKYSKFIQ